MFLKHPQVHENDASSINVFSCEAAGLQDPDCARLEANQKVTIIDTEVKDPGGISPVTGTTVAEFVLLKFAGERPT